MSGLASIGEFPQSFMAGVVAYPADDVGLPLPGINKQGGSLV